MSDSGFLNGAGLSQTLQNIGSSFEGYATIVANAIQGTSAHYGTCSTASSTAAKTVTVSGVTALNSGTIINVTFTNGIQVANATLNVNDLGAKTIRYNGANLTSSFVLNANTTCSLIYDGTYWVIVDASGKAGTNPVVITSDGTTPPSDTRALWVYPAS